MLKTYALQVTPLHCAYDERDGFQVIVTARTLAEARKRARAKLVEDGLVTRFSGRLTFKVLP